MNASVRTSVAKLSLYTRYGERVEGGASVQVVWGTPYDVWPSVTTGAWASNGTIVIKGNGFLQGWSRCNIVQGNQTYWSMAEVLAGDLLRCQQPLNQSAYLLNDTIVKVQIQNYFNDELDAVLRSQFLSIETERAVFDVKSMLATMLATPNDTVTANASLMSDAQVKAVQNWLASSMPEYILSGSGVDLSLNLSAASDLLSAYDVQCLFRSPRLSRTGVKESASCSLSSSQLAFSSIFSQSNDLKVGLRVNSTLEIWLQRNIRILPKLTIKSGILEPEANYLSVWISSFNYWSAVPVPTFTATVKQGGNSSVVTGEVASRGLTGEYEVRFPVDYIGRTSEGLQLQIAYNISAEQVVNLDLNVSYLQNRVEILATITPLGDVLVHGSDGSRALGTLSNSTYCRFNSSKGFIFALATPTANSQSLKCSYP